jgi:acetyl esterase
MTIDPQAKVVLDLLAAVGFTFGGTDPVSLRESMALGNSPSPIELAEVTDRIIPGPGGDIPIRIYRSSAEPGLPVVVFFHGGGWVVGNLESHDHAARAIASKAECVVVAVDYRLAPEHKFPAAVDDAWAATEWVATHADELGVDATRLAVAGDSAGGNLAAAVALAWRDAGEPIALKFQLLIYPATDMRALAPSHISNGQGYMLTSDTIAFFRSHYLDPEQYLDWRASPLLHTDLSGLPPALVLTAGFDPLRDEGRQYADALSAAGSPAQYVCFERQIHGFITMGKVIDEANTAVGLCALALRRALA